MRPDSGDCGSPACKSLERSLIDPLIAGTIDGLRAARGRAPPSHRAGAVSVRAVPVSMRQMSSRGFRADAHVRCHMLAVRFQHTAAPRAAQNLAGGPIVGSALLPARCPLIACSSGRSALFARQTGPDEGAGAAAWWCVAASVLLRQSSHPAGRAERVRPRPFW